MEYSRLTVFGQVVWELMAVRGMTSWASLCRVLAEHGHEFNKDTVANWARGRPAVHRRFPVAIAEVLRLDDAKRVRLADAFTYRQDEVAAFDWRLRE